MSQKSAAWNLAFQLVPAVGLVFLLLGPTAQSRPTQFFAISAALYMVGLGLFLAAKVSLFRERRYVSWGSEHMTVWNRRAYRIGYVFMLCGIVGGVVFAVVWRSR